MAKVKTAFVLIDAQQGFLHKTHWGPERSNPNFESNASELLSQYRHLVKSNPEQHILIHIAHSSLDPNSPLHPNSPGYEFQPFAKPQPGETVIVKNVNSGFIGTNLESILRDHFSNHPGVLYLAGLTTDHCVSTTTRMAGNLQVVGEGGKVVFVEDATATWKKSAESPWSAETVHGVHTESLREFAEVKKTEAVLQEWENMML
jgi:nicotinamidase-related amidase